MDKGSILPFSEFEIMLTIHQTVDGEELPVFLC